MGVPKYPMFLRQLLRQFKSYKDAAYMHGQRKEWRIKQSNIIIALTKISFLFCFKLNLSIYYFAAHAELGLWSSA